ncbi:hypothetical protein BDF20DRAFT_910052 [Mycotypha africana]|uniref:uncharacterized protein n=1 Tax=Mycotypha africana TaxID=64632 RepID=UPI0022FFDC39|nr:uncharacterized protein BDF20DRAFT_910052 [Mycotypha africana]KAI8987428.1 hypothetical protein BDF20DRAFT_910052 [Mycotypha africana]
MAHYINYDRNDTMQRAISPYTYQDEKRPFAYQSQWLSELPPTPSSSALSFSICDQTETDLTDEKQTLSHRLPINNYNINSRPVSTSFYGSISSTRSSAASTISPDDDDESLYLLWTHQLLEERGFNLSKAKKTIKRYGSLEEDGATDNNNDEAEDDDDSIDSSITDFSLDGQARQRMITVKMDTHQCQSNKSAKPSSTISTVFAWFTTCLPIGS